MSSQESLKVEKLSRRESQGDVIGEDPTIADFEDGGKAQRLSRSWKRQRNIFSSALPTA